MSTPRQALRRRDVLGLGGLALAGTLAAVGCGGPGRGGTAIPPLELAAASVPRAAADPAAARAAAGAVQGFAAALYARLRSTPGNLVVSPVSIALALGMTLQGARGETAGQLARVLHLPPGPAGAAALGALQLELASRSATVKRGDGSTARLDLDLANSVWAQRGLRWEQPFLQSLGRDFGAGVALADVGGDPEGTRARINAWVSDHTHARITEILAAGSLDDMSRLVLVNAAYLKAPWEVPFEEGLSAPALFERLDGTSVTVPTMTSRHGTDWAAGPGWRAVRLMYSGRQLAMAVVLPDPGRFAQVEAGLDGPWLARLLRGFAPAFVDVRLPRWSARLRTDLVPALSALGMPLAFSDDADFTGMTTQDQLRLSHVAHEAFMAVDEQGTEAAAATAVVAVGVSAPALEHTFTADRPFLVVLHDVPTGTPLFVGRVVDPSAVA